MSSTNFMASLEKGGLAQIAGGGSLYFLFSRLGELMKQSENLSIVVADGGFVYPPRLFLCGVPLSRMLLVKVLIPNDVWRVGVEAIQTGLFEWVFLRPSKQASVVELRRLQIASERFRTKVFIFCGFRLPHWCFKVFMEVKNSDADPLLSKSRWHPGACRSLSESHTEDMV